MADPFDRAWDFVKNEEDPNTTGNIEPNRSSRIMDIFSGIGSPRRGEQAKHEGQAPQRIGRDPRLPRKTKFSDLNPSHKTDFSALDEMMRQNPLTPEEKRIYGSPPFHDRIDNPTQEDYDEAFKHPDVIEAKPPTEAWRYQEPSSPQHDDRPHMRKPKLGQGLLDRAKANNVTNPGSTRYQGKPEEGDAGEDKPEKPDGDKDE